MEALGEQYGAAPYGFAVAKDNTQLAEAISGALYDIKESGHYGAILDKYGVSQAAVDAFPVNPIARASSSLGIHLMSSAVSGSIAPGVSRRSTAYAVFPAPDSAARFAAMHA